MSQEHSSDEALVSAHYCWSIGVYGGVSESVVVREPLRYANGVLWLRTTWHQDRIDLCRRKLRAKGLLA
jgi:hypothetical protein